jgi:hypothetical protein
MSCSVNIFGTSVPGCISCKRLGGSRCRISCEDVCCPHKDLCVFYQKEVWIIDGVDR